MIAPTHITFAGFIYLLLLTTTGVSLSIVNTVVIGLASVLPDVDTGASFVGKAMPFLSRRIERRFGHRTLTHSLPCIVGLAILLSPLLLFSKDIFLSICVGYATHPFLDSMTVNGVKLFYPFSTVRCVFPLEVNNPHRYRIHTGSKMDKALGIIFLLACVPTFFIAHQGYERFIRFAQRNIESAVRDYNQFSQTHRVHARINAHSMLTKERIEGEFEIIGSLNDHTLLFRGKDGELHTLGKEYQADFVADEIVCEQDVPATTVVTTIDMANQPLSQLPMFLDPGNEHHLFGLLNSNEPVAIPQETREFLTIAGTGSTLRFHFASYEDIRRLNLENVYISRGILTIRTMISSTVSQKPLDPSADSGSTTGSFHPISIEVDSRETVEFQCSIGDTIKPNDVIARKTLPRFYRKQIDLNIQKIDALRRECDAKTAGLVQHLKEKTLHATKDSLKLRQQQDLRRNGFTTDESVTRAQKVFDVSHSELASLMKSLRTIEDKTDLQIGKLQVQNEQLTTKEALAQAQSIVKSNVAGVVVDIRKLHGKKKTGVMFIIRKQAG